MRAFILEVWEVFNPYPEWRMHEVPRDTQEYMRQAEVHKESINAWWRKRMAFMKRLRLTEG